MHWVGDVPACTYRRKLATDTLWVGGPGVGRLFLGLQDGAGQGAPQIVAVAVWVAGVVAFGLGWSCGPRSAVDCMAVAFAWTNGARDGQHCATVH